MTAHPSRMPMGLASLISEAKHRMRRRRSLAALLIALIVLAVGLMFTFRSPTPGPGTSLPLTSSVRAGELRISVPQDLRRYAIRRPAFSYLGVRPPVTGQLLTDFRLPRGVKAKDSWERWAVPGPPAKVVALELALYWVPMGPFPPINLHLPLTLRQPWFEQKLNDGRVGYRWGSLRFHNQLYVVTYWSGPQAPADDRSAVLRALKSIRPAR